MSSRSSFALPGATRDQQPLWSPGSELNWKGAPLLDPQKLDQRFVVVFRSLDETAVVVARSILEEAGISCAVKGGLLNDSTGISRLGTIFTSGVLPVEVSVLESDAEESLALLQPLLDDAAREADW
jgi:hypothetical protein